MDSYQQISNPNYEALLGILNESPAALESSEVSMIRYIINKDVVQLDDKLLSSMILQLDRDPFVF